MATGHGTIISNDKGMFIRGDKPRTTGVLSDFTEWAGLLSHYIRIPWRVDLS